MLHTERLSRATFVAAKRVNPLTTFLCEATSHCYNRSFCFAGAITRGFVERFPPVSPQELLLAWRAGQVLDDHSGCISIIIFLAHKEVTHGETQSPQIQNISLRFLLKLLLSQFPFSWLLLSILFQMP